MAEDTLNGAVVDPCLECGQTVRPRQEAIQCENCSFWQHRICKTGITSHCYQRAVRGAEEIVWNCASCVEINDESEDLPLLEAQEYHHFLFKKTVTPYHTKKSALSVHPVILKPVYYTCP